MKRFLRGLLIGVVGFVVIVVVAGFSYAAALRKAADAVIIAHSTWRVSPTAPTQDPQ